MDPNWIMATCSVGGFLFGTVFSSYKFVVKVRGERAAALERARASAQEALRIAREETQAERQRYQEALLQQIEELQEDVENEQKAREALQRRYEDLLGRKGNSGG